MNLDLHGHFWLPAHEAERVRGRLTWNAASGGELTLEGFLWHDGSPSKSADLLCGRGLDGTPLALVRSFLRRFQSSAPLTQHWRVNGAFLGTFDAEPSTHVLATEVDGLGAFTRTSGLAVQGSNGARDPVHITWSPADPPLSLPAGEGRLKIVDERQLDLDQDRFAVGHVQHLRLTMPQADGWSQVAGRLGIAAGLLELLADRPMAVRRQWRPSEEEQGCIDHFFRPVVGSAPDDPDKVWLTLAHVEGRLGDALRRWTELADAQRHLVSLIIEEVRLRRATNSVDRILRLTRILELLHRHRHPGATPEDDDEADKVNTALGAVPEELQGWLGDRLGVTIIRLSLNPPYRPFMLT